MGISKYTPWVKPLPNTVQWKNNETSSGSLDNEVIAGVLATFHFEGDAVPTISQCVAACPKLAVNVQGYDDITISLAATIDWNQRILQHEVPMRTTTAAPFYREIDLWIPGIGSLELAENPTDSLMDLRPVGTVEPDVFITFDTKTGTNVGLQSYIRLVQSYYAQGDEPRKEAVRRYIEERELEFAANGNFLDRTLPRVVGKANLFGMQVSIHDADGTPQPISELTELILTVNDGGEKIIGKFTGSDLAGLADRKFTGKTFTPADVTQAGDCVYLDFSKHDYAYTKRMFKNAGLLCQDFKAFSIQGKTATDAAGYVRVVLDQYDWTDASIVKE